MSKKWIQSAHIQHGELHRELGYKEGEKIPRSVLEKHAKGSGKLAHRARLALTLERFHHKHKK